MSLSWLCLGGDDDTTLAHFLLVKNFAGHCEVGDQSILASEDGHHFPHQNGESFLLSAGEGVWQIEAPLPTGCLQSSIHRVELGKLGRRALCRLEGANELGEFALQHHR